MNKMVYWYWIKAQQLIGGIGTVLICPVVVIQLLNHVQLCDPMDCSLPGSSVLHCLLEFAQIHDH